MRTSAARSPDAPDLLDADALALWRKTYRALHDAGLWRGDKAALERYVVATMMARRELALAATEFDPSATERGMQFMRDAALYARDLRRPLPTPEAPVPVDEPMVA